MQFDDCLSNELVKTSIGFDVFGTCKGQIIDNYPRHLSLEILDITAFANVLRKLNVSLMNKDKHSSENPWWKGEKHSEGKSYIEKEGFLGHKFDGLEFKDKNAKICVVIGKKSMHLEMNWHVCIGDVDILWRMKERVSKYSLVAKLLFPSTFQWHIICWQFLPLVEKKGFGCYQGPLKILGTYAHKKELVKFPMMILDVNCPSDHGRFR